MSDAARRPAAAPGFEPIARSADLAGDGPHAIAVGDVDLVAVRVGGALRVYEGRCPHQGALLGEGELDGGAIVCRNHRWRFDAATGARIGGEGRLRGCPLRESDGVVSADLGGLRAAAAPTGAAGARPLAALPGPRRLPFVGNALQLDVDRMHLQLEAWAATFGTPYRLGLGPRPAVVYDDPAIHQEVLRARPERFRRPANLERVFVELGTHGVFSAEGAAWRPQRRLAMEALSLRHLRGFWPRLASVAERLRRRWRAAAADGREVDVQADLMRFTVDVTTGLAFGHDLGTLEGDGDDALQAKLETLLPKTMDRLVAVVPYWRLVRLPSDRRVDRVIEELRAWFAGLIDGARARLAAGELDPAAPASFLEAMLVARDEHGAPFPDDVVLGNALTMLIAGEDTTANTLAWAIHHMVDAPDEVAALRRELDAAGLGGEAARGPTSLAQIDGLVRAGAIASETMRLRPVGPLLLFDAIGEQVLGGVAVPDGATVVLLLRAPAVREENFADPTAFRPARWLGEPNGVHRPGASLPFGSGPRICPGRSLALLEMKLVLATLFAEFDVERVGAAADVREVFAFTMRPEGLRVRLRPRAR